MPKGLHNNIHRTQRIVVRTLTVDDTGVSCGSITLTLNKASLTRYARPVWTEPTSLQDLHGLEKQYLKKKRSRQIAYLPRVSELEGDLYVHRVISENSWTTLEQPWSYFVSYGRGTPTTIMVISSETLSSFRDDSDNSQRPCYTLPGKAGIIPLCRSISGHGLVNVAARDGRNIEHSVLLMDAHSSRSERRIVPLAGYSTLLVCPITGSILSISNLSLRLFRPSVEK